MVTVKEAIVALNAAISTARSYMDTLYQTLQSLPAALDVLTPEQRKTIILPEGVTWE